MNATVLLNKGLKCLTNELGLLEAEQFIYILLSQPFDYTEWRKNNLGVGMTLRDICVATKEYRKTHPRLAPAMLNEDLHQADVDNLHSQRDKVKAEK
jgi:hypothetical protein